MSFQGFLFSDPEQEPNAPLHFPTLTPARRPTVQQIGKRMMDICKAEGLALNQATLDALIQVRGRGLQCPFWPLRA